MPTITFNPGFHTPLRFEDDGGFPFKLTSPLTYVTDVDHYGTIFVPEGFKTDLASIPRLLQNIIPVVGKYDAIAVVHDLLYQKNGVTRSQADRILFEGMTVLGVNPVLRWAIYLGVRVGGWVVWNHYRKANASATV